MPQSADAPVKHRLKAMYNNSTSGSAEHQTIPYVVCDRQLIDDVCVILGRVVTEVDSHINATYLALANVLIARHV